MNIGFASNQVMKYLVIFLVLIGFVSSFTVFDSHAEELYFEADFAFFNEQSKEDRKYHMGETITIVGNSSFYKEETDEHFPAPDSEFHVIIKNPKNLIIHEDNYFSDVKGKMEFSFTILNDYPIGEYVVEMIVDKQRYLDLPFFVGHLPDDLITTDEEFDIWMEDSEIVSPLNTYLMGVLCSDNIKESKDRKSVFLDPTNDDILEEHSIQFKAHYTDPNGEKILTTSGADKNSCTTFSNRSPDTNAPGEWSVYVTALWMDDGMLYETSSDSVLFQVNKPLFQGTVDKIPLNKSWNDVSPLDWNRDGESILFTYYLYKDEDSIFPQLATMSPDGSNIVTLYIPMLFDTDERIPLAKFSPDGKFIHFIADDGNLFQYDLGTSNVLKLTHYPDGVSFDYYHYSEEDPSLYSIVVSVYRESYADNSPDGGFDLLDIGNGEDKNSIDNAHALIYNSELHSFDISPDGKKILFQKTIESDYGWADRVLAYHPAQGDIVEIPNSQVNCGYPSKWTPSGDMIVYNVHSCGRGSPGGTLHLISIDGGYHELILPYTNYNPDNFVISPDGLFILYVRDNNFEIMTLAKPISEFQTIAMIILTASIVPVVLARNELILR